MPFVKGQSGNPGGRPKGEAEVVELARQHVPAAIAKLAEWMMHEDPRASIPACNAIWDRAYGKPKQMIGNDPDNPFEASKPATHAEMADQLVAALERATKK